MKPILTGIFSFFLLGVLPAWAQKSECTQVYELLGETISRATAKILASPCYTNNFIDRSKWRVECRANSTEADKLLNKTPFYFYMWKKHYECDKTHCIPAIYVSDDRLAELMGIDRDFMCE